MSYIIYKFNSFKKDIKRCKKRSYDFGLLKNALVKLQKNGVLSAKYKPHKLTGNYKGRWECHIKPDWLLIWQQDDTKKEIYLNAPAPIAICSRNKNIDSFEAFF